MILGWRVIGVLRGLWRREQADRELDAELRDFLDRAADARSPWAHPARRRIGPRVRRSAA